MSDLEQYRYPVPASRRFPDVAERDLLWSNVDDLGQPTWCLALPDAKQKPYQFELVPLISSEITLRDTAKFPSGADFNKARQLLVDKYNGRPRPSFPNLDEQLLSNINEYTPVRTDAKYYFETTLCKRPRFHKSIFTTELLNSIGDIQRQFELISERKDKNVKHVADKLICLSKMVLHAYLVINGRFLKQTSQPYSEAMPAYFGALFEQRDFYVAKETIEAEVAKLMKTPKEFDLAAYATQHTFAELLYACCMYLEWALTPQGTIFGGEALAFCSTSFAQHLRKYFLQLHIRIIDPTKLYVQFNQLLGSATLTGNGASALYVSEAKKIVGGLIETQRVCTNKTLNAFDSVRDIEDHKVNWAAAIGHHRLITWFGCGPSVAILNTTQLAKSNFHPEPIPRDDVIKWQIMMTMGRIKGIAKDIESWHPGSQPPLDYAHLAYCLCRRGKQSILCRVPPKRLNGPPQSYIHETDPIFYTLPAWEALLTEARSVAEPKPADYRLSIVDPPAVDDEETIPILDGPFKGKFAMATPHQPIRLQFREFFERLHATEFPLEWRLQLLKDTGFEKLAAGLKCVRTPLSQFDPKREYPPMTDHKPPAGAVSDECINLAGFMRHVQEDKDPSPQDANADHVCQCLMVYSAYRQGTILFKKEAHVIRYLAQIFQVLPKTVQVDRVVPILYQMLRWGSHLWHALRRRRFFDGFQVALNPAVRRVRKDLVKGYAKAKTEAKDKPASKAIEEFFHRIFVDSGEGLLSRASFWKWYIERHLKITITEDNKLVSDEAFITALCKGGPPDDDDDMKKYKFHLIDQRLPPQNKRMFLPTMIDSQEATSHTSDDCNAVINILRNEALREVVTPLLVDICTRHMPTSIRYSYNQRPSKWTDMLSADAARDKSKTTVVNAVNTAVVKIIATDVKKKRTVEQKDQATTALIKAASAHPATAFTIATLMESSNTARNPLKEAAMKELLTQFVRDRLKEVQLSGIALQQGIEAFHLFGIPDTVLFKMLRADFDPKEVEKALPHVAPGFRTGYVSFQLEQPMEVDAKKKAPKQAGEDKTERKATQPSAEDLDIGEEEDNAAAKMEVENKQRREPQPEDILVETKEETKTNKVTGKRKEPSRPKPPHELSLQPFPLSSGEEQAAAKRHRSAAPIVNPREAFMALMANGGVQMSS